MTYYLQEQDPSSSLWEPSCRWPISGELIASNDRRAFPTALEALEIRDRFIDSQPEDEHGFHFRVVDDNGNVIEYGNRTA